MAPRKEARLEFDPVRHAYTLDGLPIPGVTSVIAPLNDFSAFIREGILAEAARRGTAVHFATELHDLDRLACADCGALPGQRHQCALGDGPDPFAIPPEGEAADEPIWRPEDDRPEVVPYLDGWRRFLADTGFDVHAVEERACSRRHRYAGTIDRLGMLNGERCVIDIKTTATLNPQVGVQLAAYQVATNEGRPRADHYRKRFACQLRRDGSYRLEQYREAADWSVFLALLTLHNWRLRFRKGKA